MNLRPAIAFPLLVTLALSLTGWLVRWENQTGAQHTSNDSIAAMMMSESRRAFANHFFVKADRYYHQGYYPSIFDEGRRETMMHIAEVEEPSGDHDHAGHDHKEHDTNDPAAPLDWIDRFGRNFYPSEHRHLSKPGDEREILPWLRLAAELDPSNPEVYVVSAYWLRKKLNRAAEAEQFLREGIRQNPDSYEILIELGTTRLESANDVSSARNIWELAGARWLAREAPREHPDVASLAQILANLARLEEGSGNLAKALIHLERLVPLAHNPAGIQSRIDRINAQLAAPKTPIK